MANDTFNCFTSLLENIPGWIAELEETLKAAYTMQEEIVFANQPRTPSPPPSRKLSTSSSIRPRRSGDEPTRTAPKPLTNADAAKSSQGKRKTVSVASGGYSGPSKFSAKAAAVVYYDGDTQKRFEKLVRNIGSSRNAIRKGKMAAKVDGLARSGSTSSASSNSGPEDGDYSKVTLKYKFSRPRLPAFGRNDGSEAFDKVDGKLEKAQSLCERAAHQILRDGDCTLELNSAKEHFLEALHLAKAELPAIKKRAEKAADRRRREDERQRLEDAAEARARANNAPVVDKVSGDKVGDIAASITFPSEGNLEVDLEVDDGSDDDDQGDFKVTSLQFGKISQLRSTRLAAY